MNKCFAFWLYRKSTSRRDDCSWWWMESSMLLLTTWKATVFGPFNRWRRLPSELYAKIGIISEDAQSIVMQAHLMVSPQHPLCPAESWCSVYREIGGADRTRRTRVEECLECLLKFGVLRKSWRSSSFSKVIPAIHSGLRSFISTVASSLSRCMRRYARCFSVSRAVWVLITFVLSWFQQSIDETKYKMWICGIDGFDMRMSFVQV